MRNQYSEPAQKMDLTGLENAVRDHVRERQRQEREALADGRMLMFPIAEEDEDLPDAA